MFIISIPGEPAVAMNIKAAPRFSGKRGVNIPAAVQRPLSIKRNVPELEQFQEVASEG